MRAKNHNNYAKNTTCYLVAANRRQLQLPFKLTVEDYESCLALHGRKCFVTGAEGITLVLAKAVPTPTSWRDLCPVIRQPKFTSRTRGAGLDLARVDGGRHVQRFREFMTAMSERSNAGAADGGGAGAPAQ